jgi:hypothetical protein
VADAPGPGRALALVYAFFSLAAGARSGVQLVTEAGHAPLAYGLSAGAAALYLIGTIAVIGVDRGRWPTSVVTIACGVELTGVLAVGTFSLAHPADFPDATVWSHYGAGYLWIPLALPVLGLVWAYRRRAPRGANAYPPIRDSDTFRA